MRQTGDSRFGVLATVLMAANLIASLGAAESRTGFDPYVVTDLQIAVTAADAVAAKDKAIAQAMEVALDRVLRRLTVETQRNTLPRPNEALADRLLDRLTVEAERFGTTRYSARISVAFSPLAVRGFLHGHGIRPVEDPAPPTLLVPVLVENETPLWWDAADPWATALKAVAFEDGLTPVRLPNNSRADRDSPHERILAADRAVLAGFQIRYRTQGLVAAIAKTVPGRSRVQLRLVGADAAGPLDIREEVASGGLPGAAERVAAVISERWKSALVGTLGQDRPLSPGLEVRVLLHGRRAEWAEIQRRLSASGTVQGLSVNRMAEQSVELTIWPRGEPGGFAERLAIHGLDLFEAGGIWLLQSY